MQRVAQLGDLRMRGESGERRVEDLRNEYGDYNRAFVAVCCHEGFLWAYGCCVAEQGPPHVRAPSCTPAPDTTPPPRAQACPHQQSTLQPTQVGRVAHMPARAHMPRPLHARRSPPHTRTCTSCQRSSSSSSSIHLRRMGLQTSAEAGRRAGGRVGLGQG